MLSILFYRFLLQVCVIVRRVFVHVFLDTMVLLVNVLHVPPIAMVAGYVSLKVILREKQVEFTIKHGMPRNKWDVSAMQVDKRYRINRVTETKHECYYQTYPRTCDAHFLTRSLTSSTPLFPPLSWSLTSVRLSRTVM